MDGKKVFNIGFVLMIMASMASATAGTNVVVDYYTSTYDSRLRPGDSGIMNLVIENTGGYQADDVEVRIISTAKVSIDKSFFIGRMESGDSSTVPLVLRVKPNATTGLTAINVRITYDGTKNDGSSDNNKITSWDIPLRIYGDPSFQIEPSKTSFYKDTMDTVTFEGKLLSPVKDLEARLASDCATVIGSSKKYIGDLSDKDRIKLVYDIKPTATGACSAWLVLDYKDESGSAASENLTYGINVERAGVDFKVQKIAYDPIGPGEAFKVDVKLKNVGRAVAEETTIAIDISDPFVPVDTTEKYIGQVAGGEEIDVEFDVAVSWDADLQAYGMPLVIDYKVGGTSYNVSKNIGLDVSGEIVLEIINIEQRSGSVRVEVANIGTRTAEGLKATLQTIGGNNRTKDASGETSAQSNNRNANPMAMLRPARNTGSGGTRNASMADNLIDYKSDIKATKQTTFTFDTSYSGPAIMTLEYTGLNNKRVTQVEHFTIGSGSAGTSIRTSSRTTDSGYTTYVYYGLAALAAYLAYRLYRKRKQG